MYLKSIFIFIIICINLIDSADDKKFEGCVELEKIFKELCKEGGPRKEKIMSKANRCYIGMLPPDADKNLKEYFEKKCGDEHDFCDEKIRQRCGPQAFEQMDEKQKEGAMQFYEKHQKDFPIYCNQGLVGVEF